MDQVAPEPPARPRSRRTRRTRALAATAGTALLAVAGIVITAVARESPQHQGELRQTVSLSADATSALAGNWYESAPYYSVLDSNAPNLGTVMSATGQKAFDFDLEEPEIENSAAIASELGAAQILQRSNPGLFISVTIPSVATGANYFGQQLLDEAKTPGFTPDDYTIMPFDGGFNGGSSQVTALQDFNAQLVSTFGWSSSQACAHEGFSGMNGRTDSAEYFYQSDFQTVLSFAQSVGLGRFTFWSVNRDRECNPPGNNGGLSSECSSVPQNSWDFTPYTVAFAKSAPVTEPSPTPTSTPTTPGSCAAAAWSPSTAYVSGDVVSYGGDQWTANQWNYDEVPGGPAGAWTSDGAC